MSEVLKCGYCGNCGGVYIGDHTGWCCDIELKTCSPDEALKQNDIFIEGLKDRIYWARQTTEAIKKSIDDLE